MKVTVLLSLVAFATNFVNGETVFSGTISDPFLDVAARQLSDIIKNRGEARNDEALPLNDIIDFESQHVDLCGTILCISANLTKGSVVGLFGYEIYKLDVNSEGMRVAIDIDIGFPKLQLDAEKYEMKGNIMEAFPLAGEGKLRFEMTGLRFWTRAVLQLSDQTSIETFENSGYSIESILSATDFDHNIDGVFNAMVGELLPGYLNRFNKAIAAYYADIVKELINPILK